MWPRQTIQIWQGSKLQLGVTHYGPIEEIGALILRLVKKILWWTLDEYLWAARGPSIPHAIIAPPCDRMVLTADAFCAKVPRRPDGANSPAPKNHPHIGGG